MGETVEQYSIGFCGLGRFPGPVGAAVGRDFDAEMLSAFESLEMIRNDISFIFQKINKEFCCML